MFCVQAVSVFGTVWTSCRGRQIRMRGSVAVVVGAELYVYDKIEP